MSGSTYERTAATVTVGQTLPGGGTAVANGTYLNVFENATVDGSFGVTSPLILREYVLHGHNRPAVLVKTLNVTDRTGIVTSFSSKSELALDLSTSGSALTFMDKALINTLDVSNSNTPPMSIRPIRLLRAISEPLLKSMSIDRPV